MIEWYQNLAPRERRFVLLGALFVGVLLVYAFLYQPLETTLQENKTKLAQSRSEWTQLVRITDEYKALGTPNNAVSSDDNRSLLAIIDQSGAAIGVKSSIKRLTPEGAHKVRVQVEDVEFDKLLKWLVVNSTKHSVHAELFLVRQTERKGRVDATLLFSRG